jgi:RNA polymerase sigma factor (sigma-70 family)
MTDVELVPLAAAGDVEAFERLYRAYYSFAVNHAQQLTRDRYAAEDAAQTTFMWLLQGRWRLDALTLTDRGNLFGFIRTLTVYASWRTYRPHDGESDEPDYPSAVKLARSTWPSPEARLLAREVRHAILSAIDGLYPPYLRHTARLRYLTDPPLSSRDIARQLGVKPCTVPGYLDKARKALRPALAGLVTLPEPGGRARGTTRHIRIDDSRYNHAD